MSRKTEGRSKASRWHEQPHSVTLPTVADEAAERPLVPPEELSERLSRQVLVHLMQGHWALAHVALTAGEKEARELLGRPAISALSIGERLAMPAAELCLGNRVTNALERAGAVTVGQVVEKWPLMQIASLGNGMRTAIAKILHEWQLLSLDQVRAAYRDCQINRWWHDSDMTDERQDLD